MPSFGSATVRSSKTKTRTKTSTSTTTSTKSTTSACSSASSKPSRPIPPPPKRRRITPSPPSSDRDGDSTDPPSDFDRDFALEAEADTAEAQAKEADRKRRELLKAYKARGEELPPELRKKPTKKEPLRKRVSASGRDGKKAAGKAQFKDDEWAVVQAVAVGEERDRKRRRIESEGRYANTRRRERKGDGMAANDDGWDGPDGAPFSSSSEEEGERMTRPTLDLGAKSREVRRRNGWGVEYSDGEWGDDEVLADRLVANSDDAAAIKKHLGRRWLKGKDPTRMSAERKKLEIKYNPLISLLKIKITVVTGADESESDDDAGPRRRTTHDTSHIANETDSDESDLAPSSSRLRQNKPKQERESEHEPDTDWESDGMGQYSSLFTATAAGREEQADSEEDDVKPRIGGGRTTTPMGSPEKPFVPLPAPPGVEEDVKPVIVLDEDDEEEPDTEDEVMVVGDVKPSAATLAAAVKRESPSPAGDVPMPDASTSAVKLEDAPSAPASDEDAEPDTEDEDVEIAAPPASLHPHFATHSHAHAPSSSQPGMAGSSQLFSSTKGESQSQMSQHYSSQRSQSFSQSQSKVKGKGKAKAEPVDEDDDDDEVMVYDVASVSATQRAAKEKQRAAARQRAIEEEIAADRVRRRLAEREKEREAKRESEPEEEEADAEEEDGDEEELPAWEMHRREGSQPRKLYPQKVTKGRPKFLLQDAKQAAIGPHKLSRDPDDDAVIPAPINKFLRPYQREGVEFLYAQYAKGMGGILGDDMGLGKTIQVIAFLSAVTGKTGYKRDDAGRRKDALNVSETGRVDAPSDLGPTVLIVCPASVVHNWEREFKTWAFFDVAIYAGTRKEKDACLERFNRGYVDVVIGSFEAVRNDIDQLSSRDFSLIICDEAHRVKNPKSRTTIALGQFPTKLRYGLTGTAVQNRLSEFWCILNWVAPGKVGTHAQWDDLVAKPLKYAQKADATDDELVIGRSRATALVSFLLPLFWLRRTKDSVKLQLPKKTDNVVLCPLTSLQKDVYARLLALEDVKIMLTADDPCPCGAKDKDGLPYRRGSCCEQQWTKLIFKYITLFQKVSNHLALIYPDNQEKESNPEKYEQDLEWVRAAFPDDWQKRRPGVNALMDSSLCGKWKILCELLQHWHAQGDKVLIFSMSLKVLGLLEDFMEDTHYKYKVLDGSTPQEDRMGLVDDFNNPKDDIFCFLISTRAGGVGLNLTAANRVVIFDPNWNPSHDLQAMDRAYRFGQTREVNVYRLIGAGTLEELIYNRQQYKRALASTAYDASAERRFYTGVEGEGKTQQGELWGVKNIFKFSPHLSLTEKSIQRADLAELEYLMQSTALDPAEDEDGRAREMDEPDPEDVVAEVTGYSRKADPEEDMTPAERAAHQRQLDEQAQIARILGGMTSVQSDQQLGGSGIENLRGRKVVQAHVLNASKPKSSKSASPTASRSARAASSKPSASARRAALAASDSGSEAVYDPLARGKKKPAAVKRETSTPAPSASSSSSSVAAPPTLPKGASHFLPTGIPLPRLLSSAGYGTGHAAVERFYAEVERAGTEGGERAVRGVWESLGRRWRAKEGGGGGVKREE